jgi:hypothetical protein
VVERQRNTHTDWRTEMDNPMNEMLRAQQEAATRAAEGWLKLLQPGVTRAPHTPPRPAGDNRTQVSTSSDTTSEDTREETADEATDSDITPEVAAPETAVLEALQAIRAIQNLGDGQRDFAEHMTHWAELQRDLADSMTAWASQQRKYADALDRLLAPFSPRT